MANEPIFVGVDPASNRLALVAIYKDMYEWARIPDLGGSGHVACSSARIETLKFLDSLPWPEENIIAYIEEPVLGRGGVRSTMVQAFTNGAIQGALHEWGCEVKRANVSSWKKVVVGRGNATKAQVQQSLRFRWPSLYQSISGDEDLCDATSIAIYGRHMVGK